LWFVVVVEWLEKLVMVVKENRHVGKEKRERKMDFVIFVDV
jgi:hypothetical protein